MRFSLIISLLFHGFVVLAATYGLPWIITPPLVIPDAIPVQLVRVAEETTPPKPKPAPKQKKKFPPQAVAPPPASEDRDAVPLPSLKPKPAKRVAYAAPRPRQRPPSRHKFDKNKIAALLNKRLSKNAAETPVEKLPDTKSAKVEPAKDLPMTISERDALRARLAECWTLPAGAREAQDLVVKIRVNLNPDGSLARLPEIVDQARVNQPGQEFYRAAAVAALRAVMKCEPFTMPVGKSSQWRAMVLTFNPKDMFGG